jgi:choline-glycine betaine transporter
VVVAESISIDPGLLVLILAIVFVLLLAAAGVVVVGVVAGYRSGRDPERQSLTVVWAACVGLEALVLLAGLADGGPAWPVIAGAALAAAVAARVAGRRRRL